MISDIRDIVQRELQDDVATKVFNTVTILPFLPFTPKSLGQLLRHRINTYYTTTANQLMASTSDTNLCPTSTPIVVTDRAIHAMIDERNVEYLEWRTKSKRSNKNTDHDGVPVKTSTTTIKIVVEGANAIHDHNPIMTKLYTQLHQVIELLLQKEERQHLHSSGGKVLFLDYDTTSTITLYDRGMFQLCDSTPIIDDATTASSSLTNYHNCKLLRRFQI